MKSKIYLYFLILTIAILNISSSIAANKENAETSYQEICKKIESVFKKADIPGLSLVFVDNDSTYIKSWGYADIETKTTVTPHTLFEIGSNSKAFTALAILKLEEDSLINLDDYISKYIPWLNLFYAGKEVQVTLRQFLHHTSGIPEETISKIPQGEGEDMLKKTVQVVNNLELKTFPGQVFEYATINYDILGLVIQEVSKLSFEAYLQKNIFQVLNLKNTSVGKPTNQNMATAYKIGFFSPRKYNAPRFAGNNPAGYVISDSKDIAQWIKYQLGLTPTTLDTLIKKSHTPDYSVSPSGLASYGAGWHIEPYGEKQVFHTAANPNFTSFIGLFPGKKQGFALLANSNSDYTSYLGWVAMSAINHVDSSEIPEPENSIDKIFSLLSIILSVFILGILTLLAWIIKGIIAGERKIKRIELTDIIKIIGGLILTLPFIYAVYLLPDVIMEFTWQTITVWAPVSLKTGCALFVFAVLGVWILNLISILIPTKNKYYKSLPLIIVLSVMSGLANMVIILILINAIGSDTKLIYQLYYFSLVLAFYIASQKVVQTKLIRISLSIVYELRMKLINKIFLSSFQKYEKIDNGRVFATLNQDTATISNSVNILISLVSSIITIVGAFFYLGTISLTATLFILVVIALVAILYFRVSSKTNILFEQARETANVFSGLIDGLLHGFKELSLSRLKKKEYTSEIETSCSELKNKSGKALVKFVNAFVIGETLLIVVLGSVSFLIPTLFPQIPDYKLLGIIMIVLYLIGPINAILNSIPNIMQIKISWGRIKQFIDDIEPDLKLKDVLVVKKNNINVQELSIQNLEYKYKNEQEENNFKVGPLSLNVKSGEILFIIGGNGSGKSTLANLLTGLYIPDEGEIKINGNAIDHHQLGDLYSTIFSNHHIFKKLYGIDLENREDELNSLLKLLHLDEKVSVENNSFSSINLSNGQRKRLSLMKAFLENSQVYLFDEWAADQDPEYKKIFYRKLLPEMKKNGKIVIAITHDDNYFDVADKIVKMDMGKMREYDKKDLIEEIVAN